MPSPFSSQVRRLNAFPPLPKGEGVVDLLMVIDQSLSPWERGNNIIRNCYVNMGEGFESVYFRLKYFVHSDPIVWIR